MMSKRRLTKPPLTFRFSILLIIIPISMAMATLFLFFLIFLHTNPLPNSVVAMEINEACNATRFPIECQTSLTPILPDNPTPLQIIHSAISVSNSSLVIARSKVKSIVDPGNQTLSIVAKSCLQVLRYSHYRISLASDAISAGKTNDARAWLSASDGYHYGCFNGLKSVNHTSKVAETMAFLESLTILSSNALALTLSYHLFGNDTASWRPPITERNGFWEPSSVTQDSGVGPKLPPSKLTPSVTVCKAKSGCDYATIQEAVKAAPDWGQNRFVIYIKEGVYEERVRVALRKTNLVFFGDGIGKTVITGSANIGQLGMTTYNSATVGVTGDGFIAKNLTIQNTAGPNAHQAVAFRSDSDLSIIENCEFLGNQDTLYAHSLRQFYKSCRIIGNVDFIFGNSAAIFQDCEILIRPRQDRPEKGEQNAITAHGRTDPAQSTGFVFQNCTVNGTEEYMALYYSKPNVHINYLGRPWKEYSRTIFIHSLLEALIAPQGWMPWSGDFALNTLYYGEFENSGPGSNVTQRVPWSNQVPAKHVFSYSVQSFIQGDDWNNNLNWS